MIVDAGVEEIDGRKIYKFFSNELYGLEEALERLVEEYFHPAAKRLECVNASYYSWGRSAAENRH